MFKPFFVIRSQIATSIHIQLEHGVPCDNYLSKFYNLLYLFRAMIRNNPFDLLSPWHFHESPLLVTILLIFINIFLILTVGKSNKL